MITLRGIKRHYTKENNVITLHHEACEELAVFSTLEKLEAYVDACRVKGYCGYHYGLLAGFHHYEISNTFYKVLPLDPKPPTKTVHP